MRTGFKVLVKLFLIHRKESQNEDVVRMSICCWGGYEYEFEN